MTLPIFSSISIYKSRARKSNCQETKSWNRFSRRSRKIWRAVDLFRYIACHCHKISIIKNLIRSRFVCCLRQQILRNWFFFLTIIVFYAICSLVFFCNVRVCREEREEEWVYIASLWRRSLFFFIRSFDRGRRRKKRSHYDQLEIDMQNYHPAFFFFFSCYPSPPLFLTHFSFFSRIFFWRLQQIMTTRNVMIMLPVYQLRNDKQQQQ